MNLSNISTLELIEELKKRKGVESGTAGIGTDLSQKDYTVKIKYTNQRDIKADVVLLVRDLDAVKNNKPENEEIGKEEVQQILLEQLKIIAEINKTCEPNFLKDNVKAMLGIYTTLYSDQSYLEYR